MNQRPKGDFDRLVNLAKDQVKLLKGHLGFRQPSPEDDGFLPVKGKERSPGPLVPDEHLSVDLLSLSRRREDIGLKREASIANLKPGGCGVADLLAHPNRPSTLKLLGVLNG